MYNICNICSPRSKQQLQRIIKISKHTVHRVVALIRRRVKWNLKRNVISGRIEWNTELDAR